MSTKYGILKENCDIHFSGAKATFGTTGLFFSPMVIARLEKDTKVEILEKCNNSYYIKLKTNFVIDTENDNQKLPKKKKKKELFQEQDTEIQDISDNLFWLIQMPIDIIDIIE